VKKVRETRRPRPHGRERGAVPAEYTTRARRGCCLCSKFRNQVQEQIQIIATAIGKPAAKALTIVKVNAKSGFTSGRKLCTDIRFLHYARINRKVAPERMRCRFPLATRVQKGERRWCADMVNERLKQETYLE
jgi:hypothetical protein